MQTTVWVLIKCGVASYKEADGRDRVKCFIWIVDLLNCCTEPTLIKLNTYKSIPDITIGDR